MNKLGILGHKRGHVLCNDNRCGDSKQKSKSNTININKKGLMVVTLDTIKIGQSDLSLSNIQMHVL